MITIKGKVDKDIIEIVRKLFDVQKKGMKIQFSICPCNKFDEISREEILTQICYDKGKYTSLLMARILGIDKSIDLEIEKIGICCQLIDDIFDLNDDINDDIETIVTFHYKKHGNLDKITIKCFEFLTNLHSEFIILRYFFIFILTYSVSKNNFISSNLRFILDMYTYFDYKTGLNLEKNLSQILSGNIVD